MTIMNVSTVDPLPAAPEALQKLYALPTRKEEVANSLPAVKAYIKQILANAGEAIPTCNGHSDHSGGRSNTSSSSNDKQHSAQANGGSTQQPKVIFEIDNQFYLFACMQATDMSRCCHPFKQAVLESLIKVSCTCLSPACAYAVQ